jgi:hypothetical protein
VVCKLRLHAVCGGPTTISFKVPKQSHQEAISTRFLLVTHFREQRYGLILSRKNLCKSCRDSFPWRRSSLISGCKVIGHLRSLFAQKKENVDY